MTIFALVEIAICLATIRDVDKKKVIIEELQMELIIEIQLVLSISNFNCMKVNQEDHDILDQSDESMFSHEKMMEYFIVDIDEVEITQK